MTVAFVGRLSRRYWTGRVVAGVAVLTIASGIVLVPLVWAFLTSVKTSDDILRWPPTLLPSPLTLVHYVNVFISRGISTYLLNTVVVLLATTVVTLCVACPLAYVTARFRFRLRGVILLVILATVMIPSITILLPLFLIAQQLGLLDSYTILILIYSATMTPQIVWVLRGFFLTIPLELEEAARIDGCSRLTAFLYVVLPLVRPGLGAACVLIFVYVWNDFLINVTMSTTESARMIQVGLAKLITDTGVSWGEFMAFTTIITLPPVIAFLLLQRHFLQSLISGAVKG